MVFNTGPYTDLPDNSILITANMQSETGFPSSHQLKSYVAFKSRLKLAARAVLSADAGLLVLFIDTYLLTKYVARGIPHTKNQLSVYYSAPRSCNATKGCTTYGNSIHLSVRPSVRLSVRLSVTRRYCAKTTARSTVQFALSYTKMCLVL